MIWLTWRQHRTQAATTVAFVGAVCALLAAKGSTVHSYFNTTVAPCLAQHGQCENLINTFENRFSGLQLLIPLVLVLPLLIGLFWGAPLVAREMESGTFRLAWTQSVTRRRWLLTKVGVLIAGAVVLAAAYSALSSWFSGPFNRANSSRLQPGIFDLQGIVPIAYTVFALALGVAMGAVFRRVLPAMAATLGGFVLVRVLVELLARPHFLALRTRTYAALGGGRTFGDWVVSGRIFTSDGRLFSTSTDIGFTPLTLARWCPGVDQSPAAFADGGPFKSCVRSLGLQVTERYHPASQYWTFQAIESALFLAAAAGCIAFAVWWIRRRSS